MRKDILVAFTLACITLIAPLTGIAQENKVSSNLTEQSDIEGFVAQIRTVVDKILEKYGHIPMVSSLCNVILNSLDLVVLWVICEVIFIICLLFAPVVFFLFLMRLDYIAQNIFWTILHVVEILDTYCPYNPFEQSFKSIYTMLETKDNINTFDGCPCLQE